MRLNFPAVLRGGALASALASAFAAGPAAAQAPSEGNHCIVAGRLNEAGAWAPRFAGVQLLADRGRAVAGSSREALAQVRQVRLSHPALLARCDGDRELTRADDDPAQAKTEVPAVTAGLVDVETIGYPKLRTGGTLVELRLRLPPERIVSLMR